MPRPLPLGEVAAKQTERAIDHCGEGPASPRTTGGGTVSLQIGQELLGGLGVGGSLQHSGGVDDLTAHLGGGLVHGGQTGAVSVGAVDDTGVHTALADLGGDFLDVGAVGDDTGSGQSLFVEVIVG